MNLKNSENILAINYIKICNQHLELMGLKVYLIKKSHTILIKGLDIYSELFLTIDKSLNYERHKS